ncbi:MAG TPA: carbohydrate kinase family protein [Fimbriimonadaceae bacterium]|nr:carbohydrate kinase family protein [Fimbriimonadaceae bacterium]
MILVFGTICIDRIRAAPFFPAVGGYVEFSAETELLGGEAANTASALIAWGADVELLGNELGSDSLGDKAAQELAKLGFSCQQAAAADTPFCDIYVTPDGSRTMFGRYFSTMSAGTLQIPPGNGQWFTAEPNMRRESKEAAVAASEAGWRVYFMDFNDEDFEFPRGSVWQSSTDWVGTAGDPEANIDLLQTWIDRTGCLGIITDGALGVVAGSPGFTVRAFPAFPIEKVVDSTGAGDHFRAGMLFGLAQNWDVARCLQFAAAAGSLQCNQIGGACEIASLNEIESHISDHPEVAVQFKFD